MFMRIREKNRVVILVSAMCLMAGCSGTGEKKTMECSISISCETLLDNMDSLKEEKHKYVPENGILLEKKLMETEEGSSVFDLLQKACREENIQMEYSDSPIYHASYIEGIGQLYELDCGSLSGWMYSVNGDFPNYGCSKYELQPGDEVEFVYTCDLGEDVKGKMEK